MMPRRMFTSEPVVPMMPVEDVGEILSGFIKSFSVFISKDLFLSSPPPVNIEEIACEPASRLLLLRSDCRYFRSTRDSSSGSDSHDLRVQLAHNRTSE